MNTNSFTLERIRAGVAVGGVISCARIGAIGAVPAQSLGTV